MSGGGGGGGSLIRASSPARSPSQGNLLVMSGPAYLSSVLLPGKFLVCQRGLGTPRSPRRGPLVTAAPSVLQALCGQPGDVFNVHTPKINSLPSLEESLKYHCSCQPLINVCYSVSLATQFFPCHVCYMPCVSHRAVMQWLGSREAEGYINRRHCHLPGFFLSYILEPSV